MAIADFNADGKSDIAVRNASPGNVAILMGAEGGTFSAPAFQPLLLGSLGTPGRLASGDLNGDALPDLAVATDAGFCILLSNGDGTFSAPVGYAGGLNRSVVISDLNDDGRSDVALVSFLRNDGLSIVLNTTPSPTSFAPGPVKAWIGLKDSDDVGLRLDVVADVLVNGDLINTSQIDNIASGSSGFNNAILSTIPLTAAMINIAHGNVQLRLSARRTCFGGGHNSGTVRLWYNGAAIDSGNSRDAGTRMQAQIDGTPTTLYLRTESSLNPVAGAPKVYTDVGVDSAQACPNRAFSVLGTWNKLIPSR